MLFLWLSLIILNFFSAMSEKVPLSATTEDILTSNSRFYAKLGEPGNIALSCRQIALKRPKAVDGSYWINPSEATDLRESLQVHCDIKNSRTCIYPRTRCSKVIDISSAKSEIWLGKADPEFSIAYKITPNQLAALQKLSNFAVQNITYHCKKSAAYYDSVNKTYENSLKLVGWNGIEISPQSNPSQRFQPFKPELDGCKFKKKAWSFSKIAYSTEFSSRLPIADIAIRDFGKSGQNIYVEIGPVCFY